MWVLGIKPDPLQEQPVVLLTLATPNLLILECILVLDKAPLRNRTALSLSLSLSFSLSLWGWG